MGKKSKKNNSKQTQKDTLTASKNTVDNPVKKSSKKHSKKHKKTHEKKSHKKNKTLDNSIKNPEIVLDTVPVFDEEITLSEPVEKPIILDAVTTIINIPDRWYIKLPEDKNFDPILNFYKDNIIIASLPLNDENLNGLMPVLDTFYDRPEETPKESKWVKTKKWAKKHKFTATIIVIVGVIVIGALLSSVYTGLGFGSI